MRLTSVSIRLTGLLSLIAAGCAPGAPTGDQWSIAQADVLLTATRAGRSDLYIWHPDGTSSRLTNADASSNYGRLSPDGTHVAFQSRTELGTTDIFVMRTDGTQLRNLTDDPSFDVLPAWSPDGRRIAFMSTRGVSPSEGVPFAGHIYVVDIGGRGLRRLTELPLTSSLGPQDWTRDGRYVLLSRRVDGQLDLFRLDVETAEETRITSEPAGEYGASISPDGTRIALHAETADASQIVVMDLDGANRRPVTSAPGRRYGPRWSPDGAWLVFSQEGDGDGQYDVVAVELSTGSLRIVAATPEDEREPQFVPDSRRRPPDL